VEVATRPFKPRQYIFCVRVRFNVHEIGVDREEAAVAKWASASGKVGRPAEPFPLHFRKIPIYWDGVPVLKKIPGKGRFMPIAKNLEELSAAMRAGDDVATLGKAFIPTVMTVSPALPITPRTRSSAWRIFPVAIDFVGFVVSNSASVWSGVHDPEAGIDQGTGRTSRRADCDQSKPTPGATAMRK
jgi:hypothetical protein